MIYLDYAATTPLDPRVEDAMRPFARDCFGNPSSQHAAGRRARAALDDARDAVADSLHARAEEIIFTSGGTEADNLAVKGVARALKQRGNHIITTLVEHPAVLGSCEALRSEGFQITCLQPDADGLVTAEQVREALTEQTVLVSVIYANNEVGTIQPIAEIGALCRKYRVPFHTDAVQAAGELSLDAAELQVDLLSLSAHKIYGPKGVGALYVRAGTRLRPVLHGGGQEQERRAGTESVAGIVGFAKALEIMRESHDIPRLRALRDSLIDGLLAISGCRLYGSRTQRLANNVNVGFDGIPGDLLATALDLENLCVSTGSACSSGAGRPSLTVRAMGFSDVRASEVIRLTLGRLTTEEEIRRAIEIITRVVARFWTHRR